MHNVERQYLLDESQLSRFFASPCDLFFRESETFYVRREQKAARDNGGHLNVTRGTFRRNWLF